MPRGLVKRGGSTHERRSFDDDDDDDNNNNNNNNNNSYNNHNCYSTWIESVLLTRRLSDREQKRNRSQVSILSSRERRRNTKILTTCVCPFFLLAVKAHCKFPLLCSILGNLSAFYPCGYSQHSNVENQFVNFVEVEWPQEFGENCIMAQMA